MKDEQLHQLNVQLYQFIKLTDALITDYSSISADYMLLDKPMIFTVDDYEEYKKSRGGFIPNNAIDYWAGFHVNSLKEFYYALERIITNFDDYKDERKRLMPQFYEDTRMISAKKLVDFLICKCICYSMTESVHSCCLITFLRYMSRNLSS